MRPAFQTACERLDEDVLHGGGAGVVGLGLPGSPCGSAGDVVGEAEVDEGAGALNKRWEVGIWLSAVWEIEEDKVELDEFSSAVACLGYRVCG